MFQQIILVVTFNRQSLFILACLCTDGQSLFVATPLTELTQALNNLFAANHSATSLMVIEVSVFKHEITTIKTILQP
jgi:hypothetical protein